MATALTSVTVTDFWYDGKREHVVGTITIAAGDYVSGGLTVNFQGIPQIKSSLLPSYVVINGLIGYKYTYLPGTTIANGTIKIFIEQTVATNTPLGEHTAVTLSGNVTGDTITFYAIFKALR